MPDFALPAKDAQQLAASPRGFGLRGRALVIVVPKLLNGLSVFAVNLYILSRLSPFEFGILTFAMTVVVTIDGLVNAAVDVAALKEATRARIQNILPVDSIEVAALLIKSCGWLAMLLVWLIAAISGGNRLYSPAGSAAGVFAIACCGLTLAFFRSVQMHFQVSGRSALQGATDLTSAALRVFFVVSLVYFNAQSAPALLIGIALSTLASGLLFVPLLQFSRSAFCWSTLRSRFQKLGGAAVVTLTTFATGTILARLDVLSLAAFSNPAEVGLFGAAYTIAFLPELAGSYLSSVFSPFIMRYCEQGVFYPFYQRFQQGAFLVGISIVCAGLLLLKPLSQSLLPERYASAAGVMLWLLPAAVAGLVTFPVTFHFLLFFSPRSLLVVDAALAIPAMVAYYYAAIHGGAVGVAAVTCVTRLVKLAGIQIFAFWLARKVDDQFVVAPSGVLL